MIFSRRAALGAFAVILSLAAPVQAKAIKPTGQSGSACYTQEQMQAEQLLRLHSELMVITVTCRTGSNGEMLPGIYGDFTKKNITVLHNAEQTMASYYRTHRGGSEPHDVDRLRTMLANEIGQKSADMGSGPFCDQYRDKVSKFEGGSSTELLNEVERMITSEKHFVAACPAGTAPVVN